MKTQEKFVSAKCDYAFKELMKNETVRRYFIADVLNIPVTQLRKTKLLNTFLWQQHRNARLGILDVLAELENGARVNIEIQIRPVKHWDRRTVFYLSKLYAEDLRRGEDFSRAKRIIAVNLLDFRLYDDENYHRVYRLRDDKGTDFTDILELHIIELGKKLHGEDALDDWIRLLNAQAKEDLAMIKTQNPGILEAIKELQVMGLSKSLRAWHESRLKYERDRIGQLEYARDEGMEQGLSQGRSQGLDQGYEIFSALYRALKERERLQDYDRAMRDAKFRDALLREFHLLEMPSPTKKKKTYRSMK